VNFNDLPSWQKRGIGVLFRDVEEVGTDPRTGQAHTKVQRRAVVELELPMKTAFDELVRDIVRRQ
jgi:tRNA(His) guanylyltransferase